MPGGEGLARNAGKVVFIRGVLPGERVEARIAQSGRDFDRAVPVKLLEPSPERTDPPCELAGVCGGCDWLHIGYPEQLRQKVLIVSEALRRIGGIIRTDLSIEPSPSLRYRNRMQVHRHASGMLGFMAAADREVVSVKRCPVAAPPINRLFENPNPGRLPRFAVFGAGGWLATEEEDAGKDLSVTLRGKEISFTIGCFFQGNLEMLEKMIPSVTSGREGEAVMDLYCGVGVYGAFLADSFRKVVAVERDPTSIRYARKNIRGARHEFVSGRVEDWLESAPDSSGTAAAVVNPPRSGLSKKVREALVTGAFGSLVYVSCDPVTLSRDLKELVGGGYELERLKLFDFYPQTSHVESVAWLAR